MINISKIKTLCHNGSIRKINNKDGIDRDYSVIYINSSGGDISEAIDIGKEIFRNRAYAIIDRHCHSSCANYLLPAARKVYINDNTVISMHGSLPRTHNQFVKVRFPKETSEIVAAARNRGITPDLLKKFAEFHVEYQKYFEKELLNEIRYFNSIGKDESYIRRYVEVSRTLKRKKNYRCKPPEGLYLILGPEYMKEFQIRTIREWFPEDKSEYVTLLPKSKVHYSFIYDFEEYPFWLSGTGIVTPEFCKNG